jgi:hypothetical protein
MFDKKSRYAKLTAHKVKDRQGRTVSVVPVPEEPDQTLLGYHALREGQRLDHLAQKYLDDPAGFWRICELNNAMLPETLTEAPEVAIPDKEST